MNKNDMNDVMSTVPVLLVDIPLQIFVHSTTSAKRVK